MVRRTEDKEFGDLFSTGKTIELMRVERVLDWFRSKDPGKLRLPSIQRSFVWRNEQIVNYWDSLLRGYPAGMIMVRRANGPGRDSNDETEENDGTAFHLFDGQQRLRSLLLGLGEGAINDTLRLWVDIGRAKGSGDRLVELRVSSSGQPFGYKPDAPNEKMGVDIRRDAYDDWCKASGSKDEPTEIFKEMALRNDAVLISASCSVSLSRITTSIIEGKEEDIRSELKHLVATKTELSGGNIDYLLDRLTRALDAEIVVKLVKNSVVSDSDYPRFFARLGQGGTRLTDEELTYSLIKDRFPYIHDRVVEIVKNIGRFASEIDLVLGAMRVSQTLAPWPNAEMWKKSVRPTADRTQKMVQDKETENVLRYFESLVPRSRTEPKRLFLAIKGIRAGLLYNEETHSGLPLMLLARLPHDLLDVLLLMTFSRGEQQPWVGDDRTTLIAFVMHWLIFVEKDDKAARRSFEELATANWCFAQVSVAKLVGRFEDEGIARIAPRDSDWEPLLSQSEERVCRLATWDDRFRSRGDGPTPSVGLRVLSSHPELKRRALLWLQRRYIALKFPQYDPTSTRDDDLPIDLDHVIPQAVFDFHWNAQRQPIGLSKPDLDRFRAERTNTGNMLGNLRWLHASENRSRGMMKIEDDSEPSRYDKIDRILWNKLFDEDGSIRTWTSDDVALFQHLVERRTLVIAKCVVVESGIDKLIDVADRLKRASLHTPTSGQPA